MSEITDTVALARYCNEHPNVSNQRLADLFGISREQVGQVVKRKQVSCRTLALLKYHEEHPEVSNRGLAKLFGLSNQRVWQIIKRFERDRIVVQYCQTHPDATDAEVAAMFQVTRPRVKRLRNSGLSQTTVLLLTTPENNRTSLW